MPAGRPTKLDDLIAKRVCDSVAAGNSRKCAAQSVGVNVATLLRWMQEHREFRERVYAADAKAETYVVGRLFELLDGERPSFEAIRFWLKTRRPNTWREMQASPPPTPPNQDLSQASEAELWAAVDKLRKKSA